MYVLLRSPPVDIATVLNDLKISNALILQEVLILKAEIEGGNICPSSSAAALNAKSDDEGAGANDEATNSAAQMRAPLIVTLVLGLAGVHFIA